MLVLFTCKCLCVLPVMRAFFLFVYLHMLMSSHERHVPTYMFGQKGSRTVQVRKKNIILTYITRIFLLDYKMKHETNLRDKPTQ